VVYRGWRYIEGGGNSQYYEVGNPFLRLSWALSVGGRTLGGWNASGNKKEERNLNILPSKAEDCVHNLYLNKLLARAANIYRAWNLVGYTIFRAIKMLPTY